jgi:hypothetical protein
MLFQPHFASAIERIRELENTGERMPILEYTRCKFLSFDLVEWVTYFFKPILVPYVVFKDLEAGVVEHSISNISTHASSVQVYFPSKRVANRSPQAASSDVDFFLSSSQTNSSVVNRVVQPRRLCFATRGPK